MREIIPPLNFTHSVGRKHALFRCGLTALCVLSIAPLPLPMWVKGIACAGVAVLAALEWRLAKRLNVRVQQDGGGEWHFAKSGQKLSAARIVGNPFVSAGLVILLLRPIEARWFERTLALQIFNGNLPTDSFRQLRVRLKHPPRPKEPLSTDSHLDQRDA